MAANVDDAVMLRNDDGGSVAAHLRQPELLRAHVGDNCVKTAADAHFSD
jgi:hypothetical protein